VDGLARAFISKPVIFLQYLTDSPHAVHRIDRFMAAWQCEKGARDLKPETPYTMVDSGREISWGERDYQREYRQMVDTELPRPPQALIFAVHEHPSPTELIVRAQVTNISTTTLETAVNAAMVHVVIYQGSKALKTGSDIHATTQAVFDTPLIPGDTREFEFKFNNLRGVNLSQVDALIMVDYQPPWSPGRWEMMQAVVAGTGALPPIPTPTRRRPRHPRPPRTRHHPRRHRRRPRSRRPSRRHRRRGSGCSCRGC
jgi:hypothetical protein